MSCPSCGFDSDPDSGEVFDTTFPCPKCGHGGVDVRQACWAWPLREPVAQPRILQALYHHERGRKFRPTRQEMESQQFKCPYCAVITVKVRMRDKDYGYSCPSCHWSIHRDDIFKPEQGQDPLIREDGDATRDPPASLDISVDDVVIPGDRPVVMLA